MIKKLIAECRSIIEDEEPVQAAPAAEPEATYTPVRMNKHDRAAHKVGQLLQTPPENLSRKKMLKSIPHMSHHFEKGHGSGEGEYGVVDADDLATLGDHATSISTHAYTVGRMPGPVHHFAAHLTGHVANAHEKMHHFHNENNDAEGAEHHAEEHGKFKEMSRGHRKIASRHGYY